MSATRWTLLLGLVALALFLRGSKLTKTALWADEAESSINALTILEHGVPSDTYLDQPIFENVHFREWPESAEYEFKDTSYSDSGLAAYHGWLPLYAIALSLRAFGIGPDGVPHDHGVRGRAEMHRRTWAPRVPALLFSAAFVLVVFFALRAMGGEEAAWAGTLVAAVHGRCVDFGWQARYYAPTLLFSFAAAWAVWRAVERGRSRDAVAAGVVLALLFHTHALAAFALCVTLVIVGVGRQGLARGLLISSGAGAVVALGALPWALWSGYFEVVAAQPTARDLFAFVAPSDLPRELRVIAPTLGTALLVAVCLWIGRALLPRGLARELARPGSAWAVLAVWSAAAFAGFVWLMPPATFFVDRLELLLLPQYLAAVALAAGALARLAPRGRAPLACLLALLPLAATRQDRPGWWSKRPPPGTTYDVVGRIGELAPPGTRIYATPNEHLVLAYYSGLAVQSIAPVRESFLEAWQGPLLLVAETTFGEPPPWRDVQARAAAAGVALTEEEARERAHFLWGWWPRMAIMKGVEETAPSSLTLAPWERPLVDEARERLERERGYFDWRWKDSYLFRGLGHPLSGPPVSDATSFWQTYFYRFVDPASRRGKDANYAPLLERATAEIRPELGIIFYRFPARED